MNVRTKVSSKGQVVIPKAVRDAFGLTEGSEVDIEADGDVILLRPRKKRPAGAKRHSVDDVAGMLDYSGPPVPIEDMNRLLDAELRRRWHAKGG